MKRAHEIASAIDVALEQLGRLAPTSGNAAEACDVVHQPPRLCVGGSGSNTYRDDFTLLVDLGGDDRYLNSAGGANPGGSDPVANGLSASVVLDLGGDDQYIARTSPGRRSQPSQGAGTNGAIGFLVDVSGNDSYSITSIGGEKRVASAVGQGFGDGGVGVLADLGGDDSYRVAASSSLSSVVRGVGIGASSGAGAFVDSRGDDGYRVRALSSRGPGRASADGFGSSYPGSASLFFDGDGDDRMSLTAHADRHFVCKVKACRTVGSAVQGLGASVGGVSLALLGPGRTRAIALSTAHSTKRSNSASDARLRLNPVAVAFGAGLLGEGVLRDEGGSDYYELRAEALTPALQRGQLPGLAASNSRAVGMGASLLGNAGVLHDEGGNDRYVARSVATGIAPFSTCFCQAVLFGGVGGGRALLQDEGGNDSYIARSHDLLYAQAAGLGAGRADLRDLGGRDSYRAELELIPSVFLENVFSVQGSVLQGSEAYFYDEDEGMKDEFFTRPYDQACYGIRGQVEWRDCGDAYGEGRLQ